MKFQHKTKQTKQGWLLLESLISLTILMLIIPTIIFTYASFQHTIQKYHNNTIYQIEHHYIEHMLRNDIYKAIKLTITPSKLRIVTNEFNNIEYQLKNNRIKRTQNRYTRYLNDKMLIQNLTFTPLSFNSVSIKIISEKPRELRITAQNIK